MTTRRMGAEVSETRTLLLDITERVMVEDGYAAISSRRIAKEAGVSPALIHFYFRTLDDLFLAAFRRRAEQQVERFDRLMQSPQPLHALWAFIADPTGSALLVEFMALANHRKVMAAEIAEYGERFRAMQLTALGARLEEYGLDPGEMPPVVLLVMIAGLSRTIIQEEAIGMRTGLAEMREFVDRHLERVEGPAEGETHKAARKGR